VADQIFVQGLIVNGICGCLPEERTAAQPFRVDLTVDVNMDAAAASDDLVDTVNYADLADRAAHLVATGNYYLVEALADAIGRSALDADERITTARVTVTKLHPPITHVVGGVGVTRTVTA
jgi:7,8-dihydroneopterin aldolase/epimerase/oxygenase